MKSIEVDIMVEPVAKGRARVAVVNGHVHGYTPAKTRHAESMIQALIRETVMAQGAFDAGVPLAVTATFYRERPKHLPKRVFLPVTKPDLDNYLKTLLDALNKFVFPDDSQIVSLTVRKRFAAAAPHIHLVIREELE